MASTQRIAHGRLAPSPMRAAVIILVLLAVVAGLVVLIDMHLARPIDEAVIGTVRAQALVAPLGWLQTATALGGPTWVGLLAVVVAIVEIAARRPWVGVAAGTAVGLGALANGTIKLVVERQRPNELPPIVVEPGYSFPSGHSLSAMIAYGVIIVLVARTSLPAATRVVVAALLGLVIGLVGLSRVYLGAHYPTDVVGGWTLGLVWVVLFAAVSARLDARLSAARGRDAGAAVADPATRQSGPPATG